MPNDGNATLRAAIDPDIAPVDVVGLGLNAMDYIAVLPRFPKPDTKTEITEVRLEPGGQVATALTTCARLGLRTRYVGSVGSDELGRLQIESLRREGIDVSNVRIVDQATTQMAFSLVEEGVGERTILWYRDPRLTYPAAALSRPVICSGRVLHLDGRDSKSALQAAQWAKEAGLRIVIDIDKIYDETTEPLLELVDYLIAAEPFAAEWSHQTEPLPMIRSLASRFPQAIVGITLGSDGAVFMLDGEPHISPAFHVEARDTTGAGDVFHGAFIYGLIQGWPMTDTIRFAHAAAALQSTRLGARSGIGSLVEVEAFLRNVRPRSPAASKLED